jgi:hypothetical protein
MEKESEPPSCSSTSPVFFIGKNSRGNWIAQDRNGLCGGLFVDRSQALRFALFENGHHADAIVMVPGTFELDMGTGRSAERQSQNLNVPQQRAA